MIKKVFKILGIIIVILALVFGLVYIGQNEKLPVGHSPEKADILAQSMLQSLNKSAWDTTNVVSWTFANKHLYVWDKKQELVSVKWGKNKVFLNLKDWQKGKAFIENEEIKGGQLDVLRGKAYAMFCNDSYWFIAPFKVFDEGVTRKIVDLEDNTQALLVTYSSGGVTPGDSYLWVLDNQNIPIYFKMWVKILPIGGIKGTWENWITTSTGAKVASSHKIGPVANLITEIKAGSNLHEIEMKETYFDLIR